MPGDVVTVTTMRARPGAADELLDALREVAPPSLAEAGCLSYELTRSAEDPSTFVVVARWTSEDAMAVHVGLEHIAHFRRRTADVFEEPFTTVVLSPVA
jgi:quinol monooxygenase YgiN